MASSSAPTRDAHPLDRVPDQSPAGPGLGFRRVHPSPVGWLALVAPGAVAGLAFGLVGATGRLSPVRLAGAAAVGAVAGLVLARVVDELRWRRSMVSIELAEPDAALDLLQAVRSEGVQADMIKAVDGPRGRGYALRYRARDDRRVRAVLAAQRA